MAPIQVILTLFSEIFSNMDLETEMTAGLDWFSGVEVQPMMIEDQRGNRMVELIKHWLNKEGMIYNYLLMEKMKHYRINLCRTLKNKVRDKIERFRNLRDSYLKK